jgi:PD-(D/E)XK endonuclease
VLTTDQKGSIAEYGIAWAAIKLGIDVYKPLNDGTRCDLIFDLDGRLTRIQCKWASCQGDTLIVRCYRHRRTREGLLRRLYTADEVDAFAAHSIETDKCYFLPFARFNGQPNIQLRLAPTRNNQRTGVNWAEDFEFGATLARFGAVAQLGERDAGSVEVTGSSPVGSTKSRRTRRLFPV